MRTTLQLIALLTLLTMAPGSSAQPVPPPEYQHLAHDIFKQLIEINTTHEHGSTPAAEAVAARPCRRVPAADVQVLGPASRKGNLVVRLRGKRGKAKAILFVAHPMSSARREDWSCDPFVLTEEGGYFYGRAAAISRTKRPISSPIFCASRQRSTCRAATSSFALDEDEEAGGDANGAKWLLENHRDLIDAQFVITTDAAGGQIDHGRRVRNPVQTSEKGYEATPSR